MPKLLFTLLLLLPTVSAAQQENPVRVQFQKQIGRSHRSKGTLQQVVAQAGNNSTRQNRLFRQGDAQFISLLKSVDLAVEYLADDPALRGNFITSQHTDTLRNTRKPDASKNVDLVQQALVKAPDGTIRYLSSHIVRDSWLYTNDIQIAVWFDARGIYQRHTLTFRNHTFLLGTDDPIHISGRLLP